MRDATAKPFKTGLDYQAKTRDIQFKISKLNNEIYELRTKIHGQQIAAMAVKVFGKCKFDKHIKEADKLTRLCNDKLAELDQLNIKLLSN
jgi:hypothetical protein